MKTKTRSPYAQIRLYLGEEELVKLERMADKLSRSRDNLVTLIVRGYLDAQRGGKK
ncbi:MAG: hypothetical protein Q7R34_14675 [Dehalococcoidia bacterium]|nr:hypothetical protein [Dehalococcoidia bacterium]